MRLPRTPPPLTLARGVWQIPLAPWHGINAYAFGEDDRTVTLVDTGLPWTSDVLFAGLRAVGVRPGQLKRIVLTHAHSDHAGGAARIVSLVRPFRPGVPDLPVLAQERDADYLRRGTPPMGDVRTRVGRIAQRLPWASFAPLPDVTTFPAGEILPVAGGLEVHHTPGHTPGHVSLLHPSSGVVITGDAVFNVRALRWPPSSLCTDPELNRRSADVLGDLDYEIAAFTHGPHIASGAREAVRAFLRGRTR